MSLPTQTRGRRSLQVDAQINGRAITRLAECGEARRRHVTEWIGAVAQAREARLTWAQIAELVGEPEETVRQRYRREVTR